MSSNAVRVNGAEVTADAPDGTTVNITINQGSSLEYLMQSVKSLGKIRPLETKTKSELAVSEGEQTLLGTAVPKGEQKTLGAVQIILGSIFFAFGIVVCVGPKYTLFWNRTFFWTGVMFILSGAVSVLSERRSARCWLTLAPWMNLTSFAVAIAGIVFIARDLGQWCIYESCFNYNCEVRYPNRRTSEPTYNYGYEDDEKWRVRECKQQLSMLAKFGFGVNIILMILMVLMLCITFFSVGYGWKALCCGNSSRQGHGIKVNKDTESFPAPEGHPPPYKEKCDTAEIV